MTKNLKKTSKKLVKKKPKARTIRVPEGSRIEALYAMDSLFGSGGASSYYVFTTAEVEALKRTITSIDMSKHLEQIGFYAKTSYAWCVSPGKKRWRLALIAEPVYYSPEFMKAYEAYTLTDLLESIGDNYTLTRNTFQLGNLIVKRRSRETAVDLVARTVGLLVASGALKEVSND
jgi:hypothetical protein